MALRLGNFVQESVNNPGTNSTWNLGGAPTGYMSFIQAFGDGAQVYLIATDGQQAQWGYGTVHAGSPNTVTWTKIEGTSAGSTNPLNFTGAVDLYNEIPAGHALGTDEDGYLNLPQTPPQADSSNRAATTSFAQGLFGVRQLAGTGYQVLPGGLIVQWDQGLTYSNGGAALNFPVAFPNNCFQVVPSIKGAIGPFAGMVTTGTPTRNGVTLWVAQPSGAAATGVAVAYLAVGN